MGNEFCPGRRGRVHFAEQRLTSGDGWQYDSRHSPFAIQSVKARMPLTEIHVEKIWTYATITADELFREFSRVDLRLSARRCSNTVGLKDSVSLAAWLRMQGLPRYRLLRDWSYVERIHSRSISGESMCLQAELQGRYPSILSRFILRVTGQSWREIQRLSAPEIRCRAASVWIADSAHLADLVFDQDVSVNTVLGRARRGHPSGLCSTDGEANE
jgi:hypothetical protein